MMEDYVSFETAKLLKEKGFDEKCFYCFDDVIGESRLSRLLICNNSELVEHYYSAPTLQVAVKWLIKTHSILLIVDYDYECTDTSYCYKIYRLGEHGKPERVAIMGVRYDKDGTEHEQIVGYRDYERSHKDYHTYEEACEDGIRYCLENLI